MKNSTHARGTRAGTKAGASLAVLWTVPACVLARGERGILKFHSRPRDAGGYKYAPPGPSRPSHPAASVGATVRPVQIGRLARLCDRSAYTSTPSGRKSRNPPSICCGVLGCGPDRGRAGPFWSSSAARPSPFFGRVGPQPRDFGVLPTRRRAAHPAIRRRRDTASLSRVRAAAAAPNRPPQARFCRPPRPRSRLTSR